MKAAVLKAYGVLKYEDISLRELPGWCRRRSAFAGIGGSDLGRGGRKDAYHYPLIMGHEVSSVVEPVPEGGQISGRHPGGGLSAAVLREMRCLWSEYDSALLAL